MKRTPPRPRGNARLEVQVETQCIKTNEKTLVLPDWFSTRQETLQFEGGSGFGEVVGLRR
jgi:hypothetical protein